MCSHGPVEGGPDPEGGLRRRLSGRKACAYRKCLREEPGAGAAEFEAALRSDTGESEVSGDDMASSTASAVAEAACPRVVVVAAVAQAACPLAAAVAEAACPPASAQAPAEASAQAAANTKAASSSTVLFGPGNPH